MWRLRAPRSVGFFPRGTGRRPAGLANAATSASNPKLGAGKMVLGCGSNVVDHIYNVVVVPKTGEKGFFSSPFRALEKRVIGGVTLNHLCWAALAGVPTGLMALQGNDELGGHIRTNLSSLGVSTEFIKISNNYSTAQCHVFIQEDGERSIVMAPAATSLINAQAVLEKFDVHIKEEASILTTEISQVPLSGVLELLKSAKRAGVTSILDLDVPPMVAINEAKLGTMEEVVECVKSADVLKITGTAADDLLADLSGRNHGKKYSTQELAQELVGLCGSKLIAMTNGSRPSIIANSTHVVEVPAPQVEEIVDTTGAGDAFLGGVIVDIIKRGGLPSDPDGMRELGRIANAFGATCTQSVGGVPVDQSRQTLQAYLSGINSVIIPVAETRGPTSSNSRIIVTSPPSGRPEDMDAGASANGHDCRKVGGSVTTGREPSISQVHVPKSFLTTRRPDVSIIPTASPAKCVAKVAMHGFSMSLSNDLEALSSVSRALDMSQVEPFLRALNDCQGAIFTSGVGKSGVVASRFAASLSSVGIPAYYVHATEWLHGDLGKVHPGRDVVVFLSHSGGTKECVSAASQLLARGVATLSLTGRRESELSLLSTATLTYPSESMKEPFHCLPTSSIVVQEAISNALLCELIERQGINRQTFLHNHPGGTIGCKL